MTTVYVDHGAYAAYAATPTWATRRTAMDRQLLQAQHQAPLPSCLQPMPQPHHLQ